MVNTADIPKVDVAIVGGGIAGLYAGWRLAYPGKTALAYPPPRVCIYEAGNRLGGRLHTATAALPDSDCSVEFGAMRYPASHKLVNSLLTHLGIAPERFPNLSLRRMHLRGAIISVGKKGRPGRVPFRLDKKESKVPVELLSHAMELAVPGALKIITDPKLTPSKRALKLKEAVEAREIGGQRLHNWGFWNLLRELLTNEAYDFLQVGLGIESAVANWNATMSLQSLVSIARDFMSNDFHRPQGGWSTLPEAMRERMRLADPPVDVLLGHKLKRVSKVGGDPEYSMQLEFAVKDSVVRVRARHVILALPRNALESLENYPELVPQDLRDKARVGEIPAFRLYFVYKKPWWQKKGGFLDGFSVTDQPIRQVFYGAGFGGEPRDNQRILMASYADYTTVEYWKTLTEGDTEGVMFPFAPARKTRAVKAAADVLKPVLRQLRELHGEELKGLRANLLQPELVGYKTWTTEKNGAGWHAWRPGINLNDVIPSMRRPNWQLPVYICGEAYSGIQGWVEGALTSAELMLQEHFQLGTPAWLDPQDYHLGP